MKVKLITLAVAAGLLFAAVGLIPAKGINPAFMVMARESVKRINIMGGTCSGTIVSEGEMLTAAHCVPHPSQYFQYMIQTGKYPMMLIGTGVPVLPSGTSPQVDAAVLIGDFSRIPAVPVDRYRADVFNVEEAILCGYPFYNNELRCDKATRVGNSGFAAVFDITVLPGQSGGAVFSLDGKLIGIIHSVNMKDGSTKVASTTGILSLGVKQ